MYSFIIFLVLPNIFSMGENYGLCTGVNRRDAYGSYIIFQINEVLWDSKLSRINRRYFSGYFSFIH